MQSLIKLLGRRQIQWIFLLIGMTVVLWTSWRMMELPLWGHLPLGWLIGSWVTVSGLFWRRISHNQDTISRFILSTASGLLLAFSFPVSPLTPLIFVAFVPLLVLFKSYPGLTAFRWWSHLFNAFFIWNIITTFWVLNTSFAPGIVANVINTALMTIPWMLFRKSHGRMPEWTAYLALAAYWISFEYIHLQWEISWPWLNIGNTFAQYPAWVQWYSLTGVFGGAIWIWWLNIDITQRYLKGLRDWRSYLRPMLWIVGPIALSLVMYYSNEDRGQSAEVVIIQPNYEPHYEKFDIPQTVQIRNMEELARLKVTENTDYLLFPETVISRVRLNSINAHLGIRSFQTISKEYPDLLLVSGISGIRTYEKDSLYNRATRTHIGTDGDTTYWDVQNSSIAIQNGVVIQDYVKSKLVPGAEIFPYKEWLPFLKPIIDQLDGSTEGLLIQEDREVFSKGEERIAPVICYESIYGGYMGQYFDLGANAIFVMTNDGWWDNTAGHKQHLAFSRLRAIESRRSVARAANTGISCFINQRGDVYSPTNYDEEIAIKGQIALNDKITFYSNWKDYLAQIALLFAIFSLIFTYRPVLKP